jgi:hypothetical protein
MSPLCWYVFWLSFLSSLYERRPSAQIVNLDDYRPPTDRRAA